MALLFEVSVASKIEPIAGRENPAPPNEGRSAKFSSRDRNDFALLVSIAAGTLLVHLLAAGRYGFNRDELAILEDGRHLAWGYVAYPPVTPFFGRLALALFGTSLVGFRFFASLAAAGSILLTGLIAREMGGGRT